MKCFRVGLPRAAAVFCLLASLVPAFGAQSRQPSAVRPQTVSAVRFWSLGDVTRIAIESTGDFTFAADRAWAPDRIFFDLSDTVPDIDGRRLSTIAVNDSLVREIRVAETRRHVTRVVIDLAGSAEFTTSRLTDPDRLMIEIRRPGLAIRPSAPAAGAPVLNLARRFSPPPMTHPRVTSEAPLLDPPFIPSLSATAMPQSPAATPAAKPESLPAGQAAPQRAISASSARSSPPDWPKTTTEIQARNAVQPDSAAPATRNSAGNRSMIRALGLKVGAIVLDAGHGGHDTGTVGPTGLMEKDLVLDITQRLGRLIVQRMGASVVYTRSDDTFVPLEERTRIANEAHADLFLSIHANSSPLRSVSGVETYYLNFTSSKEALDVAARENAGSQMTVGELQDIVQKIALHEKVDESREFAGTVQTALYANSRRADSRSRDRGVRKAPFVVLIGASMPSVLAEIGFVSNARDERLLRRPEQRQRIAEALYHGIAQYASGLSHFQIADGRAAASSPAR